MDIDDHDGDPHMHGDDDLYGDTNVYSDLGIDDYSYGD